MPKEASTGTESTGEMCIDGEQHVMPKCLVKSSALSWETYHVPNKVICGSKGRSWKNKLY